ncbi:MAG: 16S rRNA (cytidine(1402)-2'-O)-methyltransferase [Bacteroidetes bacterium 47-18]|nr:MAG: 16S rRNA (cytidine(1402)-2'-O)-methyltransferase [Bacteroidetes bacterium 47-18]
MKLFVVPTPVGNLEDITFRAVHILKTVDIILCEDTRTSGILLKHYDIQKTTWSYHQHNEHKVVDQLVEHIRDGKTMALITDAGTPAISDPGYLLVRACIEQGVEVDCLPGATAFVPALVQSGLVANTFVFEGFLPLKKGRKTKFGQLVQEDRTIIFYESPHRILKTVEECGAYFGTDRRIAVVREISKKFGETIRGSIAEVLDKISKVPVKGEIVVVLEGRDEYERRLKQSLKGTGEA